VIDVATTVLIYVMLGWGLNIVVGLAGLLDLGYVAFYAVGAYSYALLAINFDLSFWECLPLAGVFAGFMGVLLGFPVLRLRGDYLAIVTLGFGEIMRIILTRANAYQRTERHHRHSAPDVLWCAVDGEPGRGVAAFHQLFGLEFRRSIA
jgi:branched-chain amino acid transport system permease protein